MTTTTPAPLSADGLRNLADRFASDDPDTRAAALTDLLAIAATVDAPPGPTTDLDLPDGTPDDVAAQLRELAAVSQTCRDHESRRKAAAAQVAHARAAHKVASNDEARALLRRMRRICTLDRTPGVTRQMIADAVGRSRPRIVTILDSPHPARCSCRVTELPEDDT